MVTTSANRKDPLKGMPDGMDKSQFSPKLTWIRELFCCSKTIYSRAFTAKMTFLWCVKEAVMCLFDKKGASAILIPVAYEKENHTQRAVLDNEPLVGFYLKPPSKAVFFFSLSARVTCKSGSRGCRNTER